ncbi:hypothetical protein OOJ91_23220 [Micromonospora lupini]|uniref:hypothetical protein n=1 Tax=Micromonospora lupini TaxID=285679 RepID=UPI002253D2A2|nr:hypothetical protein [Micromonospora lupini]MCX5068757.1 hypothetical protein [Micromonospora lupini]
MSEMTTKEARMPRSTDGAAKEQILIRVDAETYTALQLAQPFEGRRSMQDLVCAIIEDFVVGLRSREPGFEKALLGLREAQAPKDGVLARRGVYGGRAVGS